MGSVSDEWRASKAVIRLCEGECFLTRYGDPRGYPVFYLHGFPGSHREGALADRSARIHRVCLYAIDRPGYGESRARPDLTLAGWPEYQERLAAELGLTRYGVIALSGGAPYAYAGAYAASTRLDFTLIMGGLPPLLDRGERAALPALMRLHGWIQNGFPGLLEMEARFLARSIRRRPGWLLERVQRLVAPIDQDTLMEPDVRRTLQASWVWGMRGAGAGLVDDLRRYLTLWPGGFRTALQAPLRVIHGDRDRIVPLERVEAFVKKLQGVAVEVHAGEGHFSLPLRRQDTIWETVRQLIGTVSDF
ncbi:alpha/beta hydrolase fold protein [mine drainage metagenome]|uniref:Alpha/beta hydrolase fold protein n=1 Tax=mine drainage metagenome TaxID=410659 RepID=T1A8P1_9ZZZZ